ncbi:MAG TPA: hypothetical protein VK465_14985, partial [Fibrobacteria bacterium]|nr:hypothetical protein [Fibrobacteria bacterium]
MPAVGRLPPSLVVHASTAEVGGAEASLLEDLSAAGAAPLFLVPAEGPLARAVVARGWSCKVLPWPPGLASVTQRCWWILPFALPGLPLYLSRLHRELAGTGAVLSSGFKSHAACLLLSPWLGPRLRFDVRDFLKPAAARRTIAAACRRFGCRVSAN